MTKKLRIVLGILVIIGLFSGCNESSNLNVENVKNSTELNSNQFEGGSTTEDVAINMGETGVVMHLENDTEFKDKEGITVTEAPTVKVEVNKNIVQTTTKINFQANGEDVIPNKAVSLNIPVPQGAKAGDKVKLELSTDNSTAKKLIVVTVKLDGTITITVDPQQFAGQFVVRIDIEQDNSTN